MRVIILMTVVNEIDGLIFRFYWYNSNFSFIQISQYEFLQLNCQ